ncbi:TetR/AcrR family transcriptional regulator [Tepidicaulis sp.]|jgi:TetR/AcrR family transcriptional regulator of autoinduction and epiphytic fitness|uniref:TetR/AcrR family transcriptional regulator n=1 Tax=Tepidicaulis sp. TaxID=1920809 RepID=UPI003B595DE6
MNVANSKQTAAPAHSGLENYRRRVSATKRRSILDAARDEFQHNGFTRAAMAEIARKADVSTATLYKHFNSKEELFSAVITEAYERIEETDADLGEHGTVEEVITKAANNILSAQFDQGLNALMRAVIAEVSGQPEIGREFFERGVIQRQQAVAKILDKLVQRGLLKQHDTEISAQEVSGMLRESLIWPALFDPSFRLPKDKDKLIAEAVATLVARYGK